MPHAGADTPLTHIADGIVDTVREPMLVLSADLKVRRANRAFYRTFAGTPETTIERFPVHPPAAPLPRTPRSRDGA